MSESSTQDPSDETSPAPRNTSRDAVGRPLVFGEVLFDHFPDGRRVLGGAPFNVAWNLQGLGFRPLFISAVGDDDEGRLIRDRMDAWGLDAAGLQAVGSHPTGRVDVSLADGQPRYEIVEDQAYDHVTAPGGLLSDGSFPLVYHGSLMFRSETARRTLGELTAAVPAPRFVDINIRPPHFDRGWLPHLIGGARWIKLSDQELSELAGVRVEGRSGVEAGVGALRREFGDAVYFVTCGSQGAYVVQGEDVTFAAAPEPEEIRDTVGAGDAFAAATIGGLILGLPTSDVLLGAVNFAARVCGITGATTDDPSLYKEIFSGDRPQR